jgi:hypothetical protein
MNKDTQICVNVPSHENSFNYSCFCTDIEDFSFPQLYFGKGAPNFSFAKYSDIPCIKETARKM